TEKDPFWSIEMPKSKTSNVGCPKVQGAKPQKSTDFTNISFQHRDSINTASSNKTIIQSELEKLFAEKQTNWK
ncbi:5957_t:CDS:2, partial [Racocetra persica]